ncbi:MAG TPA: hypothetical protein VKT77_17540 [Chthonomonadaceae bacterium]|nr:hypothetical protein [Chthonomonadaceae bacterium]
MNRLDHCCWRFAKRTDVAGIDVRVFALSKEQTSSVFAKITQALRLIER